MTHKSGRKSLRSKAVAFVRKNVKVLTLIVLTTSLAFSIIFGIWHQIDQGTINKQNDRILELEERNLNLTEKIHELEERLFNFTHPEPEIEVLSIKDIEIGQPLNACINICKFNLSIEVDIFTAHEGRFFVPYNSMFLEYDPNKTMVQWGFIADLELRGNLTSSIGPFNNKTWIEFSFYMFYRFFGDSVLKYSSAHLATFWFRLEFHDRYTKSVKDLGRHSAKIIWNNQTSLA